MGVPVKKNLQGSVSYAIELDILSHVERLEEIYVAVGFYVKNNKIHETIIDDFYRLIVELVNFWEKDAGLDVFPRRLAAYLSDYLQEVGYPRFDFQTVLDLINRLMRERETQSDLVKMLVSVDPEVKPSIQTLDLVLPAENIAGFLRNEIDNQQVKVPKHVESQVLFINEAGKVTAITMEQDIVKAPDAGETALSTTTAFTNPLDTAIKNVQVSSIIPYGYKVTETHVLGFDDISPTRKLLDDGLQLTWMIPEMAPGADLTIEVGLERRVARTILYTVMDHVDVIHTYFNIVPEGLMHLATDDFANTNTLGLNHLVLQDEIPFTFNLIEARPGEDPYTFNPNKAGFEHLVKWSYSDVASQRKLSHAYSLLDHKFFIVSEYRSKGDVLLRKLIEPNITFNELVISYYLEPGEASERLVLEEEIPESAEIKAIIPAVIGRTVQVVDGALWQAWDTRGARQFSYVVNGVRKVQDFRTRIHGKQADAVGFVEESRTSKRESIIVPGIHEAARAFKQQVIA